MRKNHILAHKNQTAFSRNTTPTNTRSNPSLIHPKQAQVLQQIQRSINPVLENCSKASNLNNHQDRITSMRNYSPAVIKKQQNSHNEYGLKPTVSPNSQFKSFHLPPRIDSVTTTMTLKDKVKAIDKNSGSRLFVQEIVQQQVYDYSPTYDYGTSNQQHIQMTESNAWREQNDQQFFQVQRTSGDYENIGMPPPLGHSGMMEMSNPFHQMLAQGVANEQMNQINQQNQMGMSGNMNFMNIGIPLPGMVDPMMMSMNQNQNFMNEPSPGMINYMQDAMPVPLPFQEPSYGQDNFMNMPSQNQIQPFGNTMRMSQQMNNSLNFSQTSNPPVQFNFGQNPNSNSNMFQNNIPPMHPQGLAQQFSQAMQQPSMQMTQMGGGPPIMMDLAGALSNIFPGQNQPTMNMNASMTIPFHQQEFQQQQQQFNPPPNMQASEANINFANSLNQLLNQGHQQQAQQQNYSYHRPTVDLITCVICKQTYDVNNTREHVQRHKSFRLPQKNQLLQTALAGTIPKPKLVIPKPPLIRPIVQPQQCIIKPQGNTYVFERIHRLEGQQVQIIDDFVAPGDPRMSQQYRSSMSNHMAPVIPGTDTPDPNFFPNYYQPDQYAQMHPYQQQFQPVPGMMTSQVQRGSGIRNSMMGTSLMRGSANRGSQMPGQSSSQLSDFSYNYMGDAIPQPPQVGVIAAQKMRVPRQVLAAWRG